MAFRILEENRSYTQQLWRLSRVPRAEESWNRGLRIDDRKRELGLEWLDLRSPLDEVLETRFPIRLVGKPKARPLLPRDCWPGASILILRKKKGQYAGFASRNSFIMNSISLAHTEKRRSWRPREASGSGSEGLVRNSSLRGSNAAKVANGQEKAGLLFSGKVENHSPHVKILASFCGRRGIIITRRRYESAANEQFIVLS